MQYQPLNLNHLNLNHPNLNSQLSLDLGHLVDAVVKAVLKTQETQDLASALLIRDQLRRLPDALITEVLNQIMLRLVQIEPTLCRWFIVDIFLRDADPEGRADVAERINLLIEELRSAC